MKDKSVKEIALAWGLSERTVRHYCATGQIENAHSVGKTWYIPADAVKPTRRNAKTVAPSTLLDVLRAEKVSRRSGGIYHKLQIELTYNSNHIEGSKLTHDQTRYIYETNTVGVSGEVLNVDDIMETANHFRCIDYMIDHAMYPITEKMIKDIHAMLKTGTSDARVSWFAVGDYKKMPNEASGKETCPPAEVSAQMQALLKDYRRTQHKTLYDIIAFHYHFEVLHPFQDGNGRVGRLLMFKECLRHNIVPFSIDNTLKLNYYRGLSQWKTESGYLMDTCLTAQDKCKNI